VFRDPFQSGSNSGRRGGPHQEYCIDTIQASVEGLGDREISAYDVHMWRQTSRVLISNQRADSHAGSRQLRENFAAHPAGSSNDEDAIHQRPFYGRTSN
jgi:hypothetical protein